MKHIMHLMRFSYDKIVNGTKRVEMRLFDDEHKKIKLNDIIEFICEENNERVACLVRGLLVFERFDDLIELLPTKMFGYDNKEEIKIRIKRRYSFEEQLKKHVVGIIIMPLQVEQLENKHGDEYLPNDRNEGLELENSQIKDFSRVRQIVKEEAHWKPISQMIEHSENEGISEEEKAEELMKLRLMKGLENER